MEDDLNFFPSCSSKTTHVMINVGLSFPLKAPLEAPLLYSVGYWSWGS